MKKILSFCVLVMISACSQVEPFVDSRREAGQEKTIGQSSLNRIAVCYNPIWSSQKDAETLAETECSKINKKAKYSETKWFTGYLITPATVFYDCQK